MRERTATEQRGGKGAARRPPNGSAPLLAGLLLALSPLSGCHASYFRQRGDVQLEMGHVRQAAADYLAALRSNDGVGEKAAIRASLSRAARGIAARNLRTARRLLEAGKPELAETRLLRLRHSLRAWKVWPPLAEPVVRLIDAVIAVRWKRVLTELEAGRDEAALLLAAQLASAATPQSATVAAYNALRHRVAARHTAIAAGATGLPGAQVIHYGIAKRYGADVHEPLEKARDAIARLTRVSWLATGTGACRDEAVAVARGLEASGGRPVRVSVRIDRCQPGRRQSSRVRSYRYRVKEKYTYTTTATDYNNCHVETSHCKKREYRQEGRHTVTYGSYTYGCDRRTVCGTKEVQRVGWRTVTRTAQRTEHDVVVSYGVAGRAVLSWADRRRIVPIDVQGETRGVWYKSPHGNQALGPEVTVAHARTEAIRSARRVVAASAKLVLADRERDARQHAATAARQVGRDHWRYLVWKLSGRLSPAVRSLWSRRWGLPGRSLLGALAGQAFKVPAFREGLRLPEVDPEVRAKVRRLAMVRVRHPPAGVRNGGLPALQAAYFVQESPFPSLHYLHGLRATLRTDTRPAIRGTGGGKGGGAQGSSGGSGDEEGGGWRSVQVSVEVASRGLGRRGGSVAALRGQGDAWAAEMLVVTDPLEHGFMCLGLRLGRSYNPAGANFDELDYVVAMRYGFARIFSMDFGVLANLLVVQDWLGLANDPGDARHWTPATIGLSIYPWARLVLRLQSTWYWGSPDGMHLGATAGLRF